MKTETFSYLPALNAEQVTRQVQYVLDRHWIPGIEFATPEGLTSTYWGWWKLPMFGTPTAAEVLAEVDACQAAHPDCFVRLTAYDRQRQRHVMSFVVFRPAGDHTDRMP